MNEIKREQTNGSCRANGMMRMGGIGTGIGVGIGIDTDSNLAICLALRSRYLMPPGRPDDAAESGGGHVAHASKRLATNQWRPEPLQNGLLYELAGR